MLKMSNVKRSIITAVCIALCVVLPMAFHSIPNAGNVLCPMHIPVLLCGLICGWQFGLLCGVFGPVLSSVITGMPPMAFLPAMIVELAVYGLVIGLVYKIVKTGKILADLYISLLVSMIAGRLVAGAAKAMIFAAGKYSMSAWITGYFVTSFPGIILQLVLVPAIVFALMKGNLIPKRYPKRS